MKQISFNQRTAALIAAGLGLITIAGQGQGVVVFTDDFNTDTAAEWSVYEGSGNGTPDYTAEFRHDYGSAGIPAAPNSTDSTTLGLKFTVNNLDEVADAAAVNAYPNNQTRSGNYGLRVDMWLNYNGGAWGGSGSTEFGIFGLNHSADKVNWPLGVDSDGVWFGVTGEGGASRDYRAYDGIPFDVPWELLAADGGFFDRDGDGLFEVEVNSAQTDAFPLKVFFPAPEFETPGAPGKRWVQVEVRQVNGELAWVVDGYLIARRANLSGFDAGTPMLGYMDVFTSIANPREENYVVYDNFRVVDYNSGDLPVEVAVETPDPEASEPGEDTASFRFSRLGNTAQSLTVYYAVGGSATPGVDYEALPGSVEIPAGADSATVIVTPLDDRAGEPDETITLALTGRPGLYEVGPLFRAAAVLKDDGDTTHVTIVASDGQTYERMVDDEVIYEIVREGSLDVEITVNLTYGGTASNGMDYDGAFRSVSIPVGAESAQLILIPLDDQEVEGAETIEVSLVEGVGYVLGDPAAAVAVIRDDDQPSEEVLFADNFDTNTASQWQVQSSANNAIEDYQAEFSYDYGWDGIPAAPGAGFTTLGLRLTANKFDPTDGGAAGVNAYAKNAFVSGNFALRFNLFLSYSSAVGGTTEHHIAGINHSGEVVNRHATAGGDGLWFAMETDASASGGRSYVSYVGNPEDVPAYVALPASDFAQYFTSPPFLASGAPSGQWVDVEIAQVGSRVTLTINSVKILERDNDSGFREGLIMVGHMDTYNSIGALENYSLIDNLRVVRLAGPAEIESIVLRDGQVVIEWTGDGTLQGAESVVGEWTDVVGASSPYSVPPTEPMGFYRLRD